MTNSQFEQQHKKNLKTGIVLALVAAVFFIVFIVRRVIYQ